MRKITSAIILAIISLLIIATPIMAYSYYTDIGVITTTTAYSSYTGFVATMNNATLASQNYISTSGLDTQVTLNGTAVPHMLTTTTTWFVSTYTAGSSKHFKYETGDTPLSSFYIIKGLNGYIKTVDTAALEPGTAVDIEIKGYFDLANYGASQYIIYKQNCLTAVVNALNQIVVVGANNGSGPRTLTASGLTSGVHTLNIKQVTNNLSVWWDGISITNGSYTGGFPDTVTDWYWDYDTADGANTMPYIEYIKITKSAILKLHYQPIAIISGTTLVDRQSIQNGVITFGTNPADVTVSVGALVGAGLPTVVVPTASNPPNVLPPENQQMSGSSNITSCFAYPLFNAITTASDGALTEAFQGVLVAMVLAIGGLLIGIVTTKGTSFFLPIFGLTVGTIGGYVFKFYNDIWVIYVVILLAIASLMMDARKSW